MGGRCLAIVVAKMSRMTTDTGHVNELEIFIMTVKSGWILPSRRLHRLVIMWLVITMSPVTGRTYGLEILKVEGHVDNTYLGDGSPIAGAAILIFGKT